MDFQVIDALSHDGERYAPGDPIALDADSPAAVRLLELGVIAAADTETTVAATAKPGGEAGDKAPATAGAASQIEEPPNTNHDEAGTDESPARATADADPAGPSASKGKPKKERPDEAA